MGDELNMVRLRGSLKDAVLAGRRSLSRAQNHTPANWDDGAIVLDHLTGNSLIYGLFEEASCDARRLRLP